MCQQTFMNLEIEKLYRQGMPKRVCVKLMKKIENFGMENNQNNNYNCKCDDKVNLENTQLNNNIKDNLVKNKMNKKENFNNIDDQNDIKMNNLNNKNAETYTDVLAISTIWTRLVVSKIATFAKRIESSKSFRILTGTTQPAHVIAVGILLFVLLAVHPNLLESETNLKNSTEPKSILTLLTYLGAFATHFGAQIWMTFVSGLSLYFALPRHTFGLCQQILFPKYFALNSMLSICTLIMYIKMIGGHWQFSSCIQVASLTLCAVIEVVVRLYLAPPLLKLMREKHQFETSIGSGQEVGHLDQKDLVKCPHYQKIHKSFRQIHMIIAMGNITVLVCTFSHLHYLASKISLDNF